MKQKTKKSCTSFLNSAKEAEESFEKWQAELVTGKVVDALFRWWIQPMLKHCLQVITVNRMQIQKHIKQIRYTKKTAHLDI